MRNARNGPEITAIICTYRRTDTLEAAITSLLQQSLPPQQYEVLVIDNNSRDTTATIVERRQLEAVTALFYIEETKQGLSYARNTGLDRARGKIVAFLDDDAEADPNWLQALLNVYEAESNAWAVGGKVLPIWDAERPAWLTNEMLRSFSLVDWGSMTRSLQWPERIIGTNCSFRKNIFSEIGQFAEDLGRRGQELLGNEDTEIQERIHQRGYTIIYTPDAIVYHRVPKERLTKNYLYQRNFGSGKSEALLTIHRDQRQLLFGQFVSRTAACVKLLCYLMILFPSVNKRFDIIRRLAYHSGFVVQAARLLIRANLHQYS
jgi:glucosyl-dolichyl phosphate glucuronosyltransferase